MQLRRQILDRDLHDMNHVPLGRLDFVFLFERMLSLPLFGSEGS